MGQKALNWNQREKSSSYCGLAGFPLPAERLPKKPPVSVFQYGMPEKEKLSPAGIWFFKTCQVP